MFDKLINLIKGKKDIPEERPAVINFGRYSDNNKTLVKAKRWTEADSLFKEKKFAESLDAFFDYLKDDDAENVLYERSGATSSFKLFQGSRVVQGAIRDGHICAQVRLAKMPQPSIPVMRRLLEMNFGLYYSRYSLDDDTLCMRFDSKMDTANPSKMYYGLKELAIKSDKQDDLLVKDFSVLQPLEETHLTPISDHEKQVKYDALQAWITETLDKVASVDFDKFSGGISYLLLTLIHRIDFLIVPEGKLLNELEKMSAIYFAKDERKTTEKNRDIIEALKQLKNKTREEVFENLFRSRYTFSIVTPQVHKTIADAIHEANNNMIWYKENGHEYFANKIIEYGLSYCQYSYSLPRPVTQLFEIFMQVNYPSYFAALNMPDVLYNEADKIFAQEKIVQRITKVQNQWKDKYPFLNFKTEALDFKDIIAFNHSFTTQVENLNMDAPK